MPRWQELSVLKRNVPSKSYIFCHCRRVHITEETLENLGGKYQVEEGNGASRDSALEGRKTYLVIDPNTQNSKDPKSKVDVNFSLVIWKVHQKLTQIAIAETTIGTILIIIFLYMRRSTLWQRIADQSRGLQ